jgi:hypothetical protein
MLSPNEAKLSLLKLPGCYDLITFEEEDIGRARYGLDMVRLFEVCELHIVRSNEFSRHHHHYLCPGAEGRNLESDVVFDED